MPTKNEQQRQLMSDLGLDSNASYTPGLSGMGAIGSVYTPTSGVALGGSGTQPGYVPEKPKDENTYRIGDYVPGPSGSWRVVENSPTDIVQKYLLSDALPKQGVSLTDWFEAGKNGLMAASGLPAGQDNIGGMVVSGGIGQLLKQNPLTRLIWAGGNVLDSLNKANEKKLDEYLNQDFNYDLAGEFVTTADGKTEFKIDYSKMKGASPESGSAVGGAQDTSNTGVTMSADNTLDIAVTPVFAQSDNYKQLQQQISESYRGMTLDQANEIVDEDTGKTRIQTISDLVKSAENNYLYNASAIKEIKSKAPVASDESLDVAVEVSKIGYFSEDSLKDIKVQIYDESNNLVEVNAKEYLDSVAKMDKIARNNYMASLGNRINDNNISDDEKAILYAQSMALYAASDVGADSYRGMFQKGLFDSIGSSRELFTGQTWNTYFGGTELETFRTNELYTGLIELGTSLGSIKALTGVTNAIEGGLRKLTPKLSSWAGTSLKGVASGTLTDATRLRQLATAAGKSAVQVGYQLGADAIYDTAKILPYAITGNLDDYDYLSELATDFAMDMLVTYGPGQFADVIRSPKAEYRVLAKDLKTGETRYIRPSDVKKDADLRIILDETGQRDAKMVEVTGDELAQRRAAVIDKLTDSKLVLRMQELWFDKNSAMGKLAVQVRKVSDRYHYQKMLRYAGDIKQVTADTLSDFLSKQEVNKSWQDLRQTFKETGASLKDFSKADWDYIKAVTNEARFLGKNAGDKEAEKLIKNFYKEGKSGVDADRAARLNLLMLKMKTVASQVLDFYVEKGLMSQKQVDELRAAPGYEEGYLPIYTTSAIGTGGVIGQDRALYKRVRNGQALIALKDLDNPMNSLARYINNAMRAVAINDRALAIREAASMAGVGIRAISDTGDSLKEVKNLRKFNNDFDKIFKAIAAKTRKTLPTFEEWQKTNDRLVMRSKALQSAKNLSEIQKELTEVRAEIRRLSRRRERDNEAILAAMSLRDSLNQERLFTINEIKKYTKPLLQRAADAHKGSALKLDIDSYIEIQLTNGLKEALNSKDNMLGKVQDTINKAVGYANPFVDPDVVIRRRTEQAAERYRYKVQEEIKKQQQEALGKKGVNLDKVNALTDKVMDKLVSKITGERQTEVTFIDEEGVPTRLLDNHGNDKTIRYMVNGKEQRLVLDGIGAEELVAEFYAPEFVAPTTSGQKVHNSLRRLGNRIAQGKRYLTTAWNALRAPANVARDWSRGIVTTGGQIALSPDKFFGELAEKYNYSEAEVTKIQNGLMLAREAIDESTLTKSLQMPKQNDAKDMLRAMLEPDGNAFIKFVYDVKNKEFGRALSAIQDAGESFTRKAAMDTAYYRELSDAQARGESMDNAIKKATEAAYFAGREATVNFFRRGEYVTKIAQQVPYLTQRFAAVQSFEYAYLNDPIGVTRALETTVSAYTSLIAIALSNEESRKKYFLLSEYDRSNNIIIPITNGMIMTIPLDDTIAAFLTPYRRMVESLNGLDPESFYLCFAEGLSALSPADFSGFSEGDGFNVARGFEKLGSEFIPTWAQPFVEAYLGKDLYYGSSISVDSEYTGALYDNWTPTPGELTTRGKNSRTLALVADHTGIPQWILQNFLSEYGGTIGEYMLNTIDKLAGATAEAQGGKEWQDTVFKPFTGGDSDQATNSFYTAINGLKEEKKRVQNEIKTLTSKINSAAYNEKAELIKERQKKITEYGLHVTDVLNQYLSAFEITGGLSKKQANQAWYLYKLYDETANQDLYVDKTTGQYFTDKAKAWNNKQAASLAASSGLDTIVRSPVSDYYDSYAEQAFKNTVYGDSYEYIANIEDIMNDNEINRYNMFKDYNNMNSVQKKQWKNAWNTKVVKALAPYVNEVGVDNLLDQRKVVDYLDEVIFVSNPWNTKEYLKQIFGGS